METTKGRSEAGAEALASWMRETYPERERRYVVAGELDGSAWCVEVYEADGTFVELV